MRLVQLRTELRPQLLQQLCKYLQQVLPWCAVRHAGFVSAGESCLVPAGTIPHAWRKVQNSLKAKFGVKDSKPDTAEGKEDGSRMY